MSAPSPRNSPTWVTMMTSELALAPTKTSPTAMRREVMRRDLLGRCVVPGCRHAVFSRSPPQSSCAPKAATAHDPDTLATLCSAHHRAQPEAARLDRPSLHRTRLPPRRRLFLRQASSTQSLPTPTPQCLTCSTCLCPRFSRAPGTRRARTRASADPRR